MLRNGDYIIKNSESIFKSQVVDSYLNSNSCCLHYPQIRTSGATASDPLYAYYETPTEVLKTTISSDGVHYLCFGNPASGCNACVKNYYFCGNMDSVECMCLYQNNYLDGEYSGNFSCSISQFPQIKCVNYGLREVDFNEDISGTYLPPSLISLCLYDCGIQGDLTTVENFGCIEEFRICRTQFTGNLHEIEFNNLQTTHIYYANAGLNIDINTLIDNNPSYTCSLICQTPGATLCADTLDISQLTYMDWYLPYTNVCGTLCNTLAFNTGMTRFALRSCCVNADISNWDISDTQMNYFMMYNQYGSNGYICGNISGWTVPSTTEYFLLDYARDVTAVPSDWATLTPNLRQLRLQQMQALSGDVTTWTFPETSLLQLQFYYTELTGDLETITFPSGLTTLHLRYSNFTGDIANIVLPSGTSQYYLEGNCLSGNVSDMTITGTQNYLNLGDNPDVYWDLSTPFDTCNIYFLNLRYLSGVTGSFSNLTIQNALQYLCLDYTPVESSLNDLDLNSVRYLNLRCSSLSQDATNFLTGGTSNLYTVCMDSNPNLSGDTTNWDVADVNTLNLCNTALSGRLCSTNPFCFSIACTDICSCIDTDLCFASNSYNVSMQQSKVQGCLSGTSLNYSNIYQFLAYSNPDLYGANDFTDLMFVNRGNFGRSYVLLQYQSIGDNVTGTTEQLGDLGTYGGDPSGMDLTEAQVNNLVAGIDYDGGGSNTPWDSKEKIWWMKNACVSSSSTVRRYSQFTISYS